MIWFFRYGILHPKMSKSTLLTFGKSYIGSHFMKFINIGIFCSLYKHFLKLTFLWRFKKIVSNLGFKCQSSTRNRKKFLISFLKKVFFIMKALHLKPFVLLFLKSLKEVAKMLHSNCYFFSIGTYFAILVL